MVANRQEHVLDSMFLVGYVLVGDALSHESENLFRRIERGELHAVASVVSLQETAYVLKKEGLSREQVRDAIRLLMAIPNLRFMPLTSNLFDSALDYMAKYSLTLGDTLICMTALRLNAPLLTHDGVLLKLPFVKTIETV